MIFFKVGAHKHSKNKTTLFECKLQEKWMYKILISARNTIWWAKHFVIVSREAIMT